MCRYNITEYTSKRCVCDWCVCVCVFNVHCRYTFAVIEINKQKRPKKKEKKNIVKWHRYCSALWPFDFNKNWLYSVVLCINFYSRWWFYHRKIFIHSIDIDRYNNFKNIHSVSHISRNEWMYICATKTIDRENL